MELPSHWINWSSLQVTDKQKNIHQSLNYYYYNVYKKYNDKLLLMNKKKEHLFEVPT